MEKISLDELRTNAPEIFGKISLLGVSYEVTRHRKVIAVLAPPQKQSARVLATPKTQKKTAQSGL
jgi:antitoxin (DNA-binding transcriptional repressor) of toxin-antitoxin stability system